MGESVHFGDFAGYASGNYWPEVVPGEILLRP